MIRINVNLYCDGKYVPFGNLTNIREVTDKNGNIDYYVDCNGFNNPNDWMKSIKENISPLTELE